MIIKNIYLWKFIRVIALLVPITYYLLPINSFADDWDAWDYTGWDDHSWDDGGIWGGEFVEFQDAWGGAGDVWEGNFIEDALFTDAGLPPGTIVNSRGYPLGMVEDVFLNPGDEYVDVMGFDIAGVMLGMGFEDIRNLFFRGRGGLYTPRRRNAIIYTIADEWRFNLDYECRLQGTYAPAALERCILTFARARGLLYPAEIHLERRQTGETLTVYLTSNATDNVVWRVIYRNDVDDLPGNAPRFINQRKKKIMAFWENVIDKYGEPNSGTDRWISSDNSFEPMMRAFYGKLELTDLGQAGRDAALNVQQSREHFVPRPYVF